MKKILMLLSFVIVAAMGESNHQINEEINEKEVTKNLSQKERFEMLFGNTALQFNEIRTARTLRKNRSERVVVSSRVRVNEQKYEMLFGNTMSNARVARTERSIFQRQARHSLYVSLRF